MVFYRTERTQLRNLMPGDADAMLAYRTDPDCARYQRWGEVDMQSVRELIAMHEDDVLLSEQPAQRYAIAALDGALIGDISYFFTPGDCITLGVTVAPQQQGRGYAREALAALIARIREKYAELDIVALIDPANERSIRLFERLGFTKECYAESIESLVYVLTESQL